MSSGNVTPLAPASHNLNSIINDTTVILSSKQLK